MLPKFELVVARTGLPVKCKIVIVAIKDWVMVNIDPAPLIEDRKLKLHYTDSIDHLDGARIAHG